jgi:hypothetical protein
MTEWTMVIILCLNAVPREQCNEETGVWVMRPAMHYQLPIGCSIASMQMLPIVEDVDDFTHPVIRCVRR